MTRKTWIVLLAVLVTPTVVRSQAPAVQPPAQPTAAAQPAAPDGGPAENFSYEPDGRRDPFRNLLGTGSEPLLDGKRGEGAAGLALADISVRGIMQSRGTLIAMIQGPDKKTYVVHSGDKLADGVVKTVTLQGLVVVQEINDPLSIQKQREVRKLLRSLEDDKE
jgi:Tfp pilus assembly protein PilP